MKDLAIYGAGGCGKETFLLIQQINEESPQWNVVGFYDRMYEKGYDNGFGKVLGGIDDLNAVDRDLALVIAMGNTKVTRLIVSSIKNEHIYYPNIIANTTTFSHRASVEIGKGNIIGRNCQFSCDIKVGDFNFFNGDVCFGHNVTIGSYNSIMPGVRISGCVDIGNDVLLGVGSIIVQNIHIGDGTRIGAGAVVMTKPKAGFLYIGNPARKVDI